MRSVFWTLRRVAMVALAVASVSGAAALTWVFVAGSESNQLSTAHLAAILALAILPVGTLAAWVLDGRAAREEVKPQLEDNGLFERPVGVELVEEETLAEPEAASEPVVLETPAESGARQVHAPHRRRQGRRAAGRRP